MRGTLKTRLRRTLVFLLVGLLLAALALWFGGRAWLANTVIPYSGRVELPTLTAPVEVLFDERGIPRIYAETDGDALAALGWLHAGERAFQMELVRRMARGELSALFGPGTLELDRYHRRLGFARQAARDLPALDGHTRDLLKRYLEGINQRLAAYRYPAPEFLFLGHSPRRWTLEDVAAVAQYQTWYPSNLASRQSEAYRTLVNRFGREVGELLNNTPRWVPPSAPRELPDGRITRGSNTWALAPARTTTGAALHAADPHLDINLAPGQWYAAGLHSQEQLDAVGVTAPGLPLIAMGHNRVGAWAFTVAPVDLFEYYREQRHPDDPRRVASPAGWSQIRQRTETIEIAGAEAATIDIQRTPRGVIVHDDEKNPVSLHWAGFDFPAGNVLENGLAVMSAGDFASFRRRVTGLGALAANWVWSDSHGNIGYQLGAPVPRRRHASRFVTLDAADPGAGWDGYYPVDEIPAAVNPAGGWLASSNNPPGGAGPDGEVDIPGFYAFHRINRTRAWLEGDHRLSPPDMTAMQMDRISGLARRWKPRMAAAADALDEPRLAETLRNWDGDMSRDSETAALFRHWWYYLTRSLFETVVGNPPRDLRYLRDQILTRIPETGALADVDVADGARRALQQALDHDAAGLGEIQSLTIRHPLAGNPVLNGWLDLTRGPFAVGGDAGSLNVSYSHRGEDGTFQVRAGASMRFVMDWSDPDAFTLNLTLGQSGHPLSRHFDDFLPAYFAGEPWVVPFGRPAVEARASSRLELHPAPREHL